MEEHLVKKTCKSVRESHMSGGADCLVWRAWLLWRVWVFAAYLGDLDR